MISAFPQLPQPQNEPVLDYAPGTAARAQLKDALRRMAAERLEIPLVIGGRGIRTGKVAEVRAPHDHGHLLATVHQTEAAYVEHAIASAMRAKEDWARMPFEDRAAIFLRAADLLAGRYRPVLNAATMLGQSKVASQAEIDAACESVDFLRFNVHFAQRILADQPSSGPHTWNLTDYRPLDGFVLAIAPFNFTAIALNLCTAPALMGNVVLLKPAPAATLSAWYLMEVLREAGLPDGVISFLPGAGPEIAAAALASPDLGGVHFTGSTRVFQGLWRQVGENISRYRQYPRLVGETGGKDFIFAHASASEDLEALAVAIVRGGYEYQGQKCSACSRVFVPHSLWDGLKDRLEALVAGVRMGDVRDFRNFMGAVIDEVAFKKICGYLELAHHGAEATVLSGGRADRREGWFIQPTLVQISNPRHRLLTEEVFGPLVAVHVYSDERYEETLRVCDQASPYALTGSIFARDRRAIAAASQALREAAGNFYVNDKPTGAVVGQQPFGGSRASGTNDKAGSALNLLRWTSPRTIKENFSPPTQLAYPSMAEE